MDMVTIAIRMVELMVARGYDLFDAVKTIEKRYALDSFDIDKIFEYFEKKT